MYKIGVIGDRESILGFKAVGLTVFPCDEAEEAKKILAAGKFLDYADEWVCYLDNISEESAQNICYRYFGDYSGIELSIADISENTPVGDYWFDYKER